MNATLKIGGPLAIRCDTCRQPPGAACVARWRGRPTDKPCKTHAARVKAAPPEQEVQPGDLVIVRYGSGEVLARFIAAPFTARVRLWDAPLGQWGREVDRMLADILRLAPEDEQTAAARAALKGRAA